MSVLQNQTVNGLHNANAHCEHPEKRISHPVERVALSFLDDVRMKGKKVLVPKGALIE